ncbi:MAG TPA: cold shock domain-containing protein [Acidimicrobiales bacterium]|nr:cold shock domain-containing protein [Acidimicrobiales bacterium]
MQGVVTEFDDYKGLGTVRGEDGRELSFHCTQIADGTRTIEIGAKVTFDVVAGHHGKWEASGLTPR